MMKKADSDAELQLRFDLIMASGILGGPSIQ